MKKRIIISVILTIQFLTVSCIKEKDEDQERVYTQLIERISTNEFEAGLIEKAEKQYPPRDEVIEVASTWLEIPNSAYWFYDNFDGVNIPYAITEDAVEYYSDLIDQLNENKEDNFFLTADFTYKAKISFKENYTSPSTNSQNEMVIREEFSSVYVVELSLKWQQYCGSLCAMWIDKERTAVFSESGELLKIFLDGPIAIPVS